MSFETMEQVLKAKLDRHIAEGQASAGAVIERIQSEIPVDKLAVTSRLEFQPSMEVLANGESLGTLHPHAMQQLATRAEIPTAYTSTLLERGDWGRELLADNFNRTFAHVKAQRVLTRAVNGQIRGVMSDSYRRLDSRPIVEAFAKACQAIGAIPVEGVAGDLRLSIRALLPTIHNVNGEIFAFGISFGNSDFGSGALGISGFVLRPACLNGMVTQSELRKVHLGARLEESLQLSQRTYDLDTRTMSSAVGDVVRNVLSPARVKATVEVIGAKSAEKIDPVSAFKSLQKKGLLKSEVEAAENVYRTGGVEQLPPGDTTYRMANALSWIAKSAQTPERRMELEGIAGEMLTA
jgi:hypothetical protein